MFRAAARFLDSLFYTTVTTTTRRHVTPLTPQGSGFRLMTNDFSPVPKSVITPTDPSSTATPPKALAMLPLYHDDGIIDYQSLPVTPTAPLITAYTDGVVKLAACDTVAMGRNSGHLEWTRKSAFSQMAQCDDIVARGQRLIAHQKIRFNDLVVAWALHADWVYVRVDSLSGSKSVHRFYQANIGQFDTQADRIYQAHVFARAAMLSMGVTGPTSDAFCEQKLITELTSLMTASDVSSSNVVDSPIAKRA